MSAVPDLAPPSAPVKSPLRQIASIAVPVSLEAVIQLVLTFINQVVVGTLGAVAVAAVGLSGSLSFLFYVTLGALASGTGILIARRAGGGDQKGINHTLSVTLALTAALAVVLVPLLILNAPFLLRLAGGAEDVTQTAVPYMQVSLLALFPGILGALFSGALRSLGHARTPLVATIVSVVIESLAAFGLVFGLGPLPELGVVGAAWALVIANGVKALWLAYQIFGPRHLAAWRFPARTELRAIAGPLLALSAPLAFTEFAWSMGNFLYTVVFARVGTVALAASQIIGTLENIFIVASFGLMSAATVFIGRSLGQGDAAGAQVWLGRIARTGIFTGLGFGLLFALSGLLVPTLFPKVGAGVQHIAVFGILIHASTQVFRVRNMIVGGGILPSAGDGKGIIFGDVVGAFVIGLPLAVGLGLFTPLGVWGIFIARGMEEIIKAGIFEWRKRHVNWERLAQQQRGTGEEGELVAAH